MIYSTDDALLQMLKLLVDMQIYMCELMLPASSWPLKLITFFLLHCRYKGEAIFNCSPRTVFDYVEPLPDGPRAKWDTNMKKIEILKWIEKVSRPRLSKVFASVGLKE